jgi:hypothetical protein
MPISAGDEVHCEVRHQERGEECADLTVPLEDAHRCRECGEDDHTLDRVGRGVDCEVGQEARADEGCDRDVRASRGDADGDPDVACVHQRRRRRAARSIRIAPTTGTANPRYTKRTWSTRDGRAPPTGSADPFASGVSFK